MRVGDPHYLLGSIVSFLLISVTRRANIKFISRAFVARRRLLLDEPFILVIASGAFSLHDCIWLLRETSCPAKSERSGHLHHLLGHSVCFLLVLITWCVDLEFGLDAMLTLTARAVAAARTARLALEQGAINWRNAGNRDRRPMTEFHFRVMYSRGSIR